MNARTLAIENNDMAMERNLTSMISDVSNRRTFVRMIREDSNRLTMGRALHGTKLFLFCFSTKSR